MLLAIDTAVQNIDGAIKGITALSGTTALDPAGFEQVKSLLASAEEAMASPELRNLKLAPTTFGRSPNGLNLADQHSQAQEVTVATLKGVVEDLKDFVTRLTDFNQAINDADTTSAQDLAKVTALLDPYSHGSDERRKAIQHYVHSHYEGGANA